MNSAPQRLDFVGCNVATNLNKAVAYYRLMAENMTDYDDPQTYLEDEIAAARTSLEESLRGYDSFDTLAFIRLATGPWDFTDLRESESQVESSQAAQDVVALTLLGMGLPYDSSMSVKPRSSLLLLRCSASGKHVGPGSVSGTDGFPCRYGLQHVVSPRIDGFRDHGSSW